MRVALAYIVTSVVAAVPFTLWAWAVISLSGPTTLPIGVLVLLGFAGAVAVNGWIIERVADRLAEAEETGL